LVDEVRVGQTGTQRTVKSFGDGWLPFDESNLRLTAKLVQALGPVTGNARPELQETFAPQSYFELRPWFSADSPARFAWILTPPSTTCGRFAGEARPGNPGWRI